MTEFPNLENLLDYGEDFPYPAPIISDYFRLDPSKKKNNSSQPENQNSATNQNNNQDNENNQSEDSEDQISNDDFSSQETGQEQNSDNSSLESNDSQEQESSNTANPEKEGEQNSKEALEKSKEDLTEKNEEQESSDKPSTQEVEKEGEQDSEEISEKSEEDSTEKGEEQESSDKSSTQEEEESQEQSSEESLEKSKEDSTEKDEEQESSDKSSTQEAEENQEQSPEETLKNEEKDSNLNDEHEKEDNDFDDLMDNYDEENQQDTKNSSNSSGKHSASNKLSDVTTTQIYKTLKKLVSISYEKYQKGTYKYNKKEVVKHYLTNQKFRIMDDLISPTFKPDVYVFDLSPSNDSSLEMYVNAISSVAVKGSLIYLTYNESILRKIEMKKALPHGINVHKVANGFVQKYNGFECTIYDDDNRTLYDELKNIRDRKIYVFSDFDISSDISRLSQENPEIVWFSTEKSGYGSFDYDPFFYREYPTSYIGYYVETSDIKDIERYISEKNKSKYKRRPL